MFHLGLFSFFAINHPRSCFGCSVFLQEDLTEMYRDMQSLAYALLVFAHFGKKLLKREKKLSDVACFHTEHTSD